MILLCIATGNFPFFQSNDDQDALLEIASIFGLTEMRKAAVKLGKTNASAFSFLICSGFLALHPRLDSVC